jgi:hypothetical protein
MARRSFDVVDVTEILIHWHAGRSISEVSTSLGVDGRRPKPRAGGRGGVVPGGRRGRPGRAVQWFRLVDPARQVTWPKSPCTRVRGAAQAGVTQATIHQLR